MVDHSRDETDAPVPWPSTLPGLIGHWAGLQPTFPALLAENGDTLTFQELASAIRQISADLRALGVRTQDRVVMFTPHAARTAVTLLGLASTCAAVPLSPDTTKEEFRSLLMRLSPAAVLVPWSEREGWAATMARVAGIGLLLHEPVPGAPFRGRISGKPVGSPVVEQPVTAEDIAFVTCTSGTTGRAKLVPTTHLAVTFSQRVPLFGDCAGRRSLLVKPLSLAAGQMTLRRCLGSGTTMVIPDRFGATRMVDLILEHQPVFLQLTPHLLGDLCAAWQSRLPGQTAAAHGLRAVSSGSAMLPATTRQLAQDVLGVPVLGIYGATEASGIASSTIEDVAPSWSVGRPRRPVRIMAEGLAVAAGEVGEIEVSGEGLTPGYIDDAELTAAAFTADGWYRTGDLGFLRDGFLGVLGRSDEVINVAGLKVDPVEVERAVGDLPGIRDVAAFAVPSDHSGSRVALAVVSHADAPLDRRALRRHLLGVLTKHKVPTLIIEVDEIPRTALGKVQRNVLAQRAQDSGNG